MKSLDWLFVVLSVVWVACLVAIPTVPRISITVDRPSLDAIVGGASILFSSAFAIFVPLLIRTLDARDARQDALDAGLDMGRWSYALVAAFNQFGVMPHILDSGLRVQVLMAEQRLAGINLTALRSSAAARRVRQAQRVAKALLDVMPAPGAIDAFARERVERSAEGLAEAVRELASIVERRVVSNAEMLARLNSV